MKVVSKFNFIFEMLTKFWYLWLLIIVVGVLDLFKPKIKGILGEKSVAFFLSKLDENTYKVINNIMIKVGNKTSQIDHVVIRHFNLQHSSQEKQQQNYIKNRRHS